MFKRKNKSQSDKRKEVLDAVNGIFFSFFINELETDCFDKINPSYQYHEEKDILKIYEVSKRIFIKSDNHFINNANINNRDFVKLLKEVVGIFVKDVTKIIKDNEHHQIAFINPPNDERNETFPYSVFGDKETGVKISASYGKNINENYYALYFYCEIAVIVSPF